MLLFHCYNPELDSSEEIKTNQITTKDGLRCFLLGVKCTRFWMGHVHCVSKIPDTDAHSPDLPYFKRAVGHKQVPDSSTLSPPVNPASDPLEPGPMILPNLLVIPEKLLTAARFKDPSFGSPQRETTEDLFRVASAMTHLELSGWYWGSITAAQAKELLNEAAEGTFLLRDSSNPGYLLTLSVKTSLGPTHLRIEYSGGAFCFDSMVVARPRLRKFNGVVDLLQHYALTCLRAASAQEEQESDPSSTATVPPKETSLLLKLTRPLYVETPSLQHLCRVAINQSSRNNTDLPLPPRLKGYLQEYPFYL